MSVTAFLLRMPPLLMLSFLVLLFAAFGVLGTYFFKKNIKIKLEDTEKDQAITGYAIVGGFYGLLLAFVVFLVWDQYNDAQKDADMQGTLSRALYRSIKYYPVNPNDTVQYAKKAHIISALVSFIKTALIEDSLMESEGMQSTNYIKYRDSITVGRFNHLFRSIEEFHDDSVYKNMRADNMFKTVNEIANCRGLISLSLDDETSPYVWAALLFGGLITALFSFLLPGEKLRIQMFINGKLGAFIALIFYIILLFDHPFQGKIRVDMRSGLEQIIVWEQSKTLDIRPEE